MLIQQDVAQAPTTGMASICMRKHTADVIFRLPEAAAPLRNANTRSQTLSPTFNAAKISSHAVLKCAAESYHSITIAQHRRLRSGDNNMKHWHYSLHHSGSRKDIIDFMLLNTD